jgi:chitinase
MSHRIARLTWLFASVGSVLACGGNGTSAGVNAGSAGVGGSTTIGGETGAAGSINTGGMVANAGAANETKWVGGYYVGYQRNLYPASEIDFSAITHLFVGAGLPQADGSIDMTLYIDATQGPALARDLVSRAHAADRKAILMLGGAGADAGFRAAAADAIRATFVQQLLKLVDDYGFDGLDLDWEPILDADQGPLFRLARELRDARPSLVITIPVGYLNINYETVDPFVVQLASVVDQMNLMTYAMAGAWEGWQSWHSSPLAGEGATTPTSIKSSIQRYLAAGIPAQKLGVGIGFYGLCYTSPVTAPKQALAGATCTANDSQLSYANIMASYFRATLLNFDVAASVPYLSSPTPFGPAQCTYLSFEDEVSIGMKGEYVKEAGLGGTIIWTINEGYLAAQPAGQRNPLLVAVRQAFLE